MKKLLAVVAVIGLVGFATSCKKECKCTLDGVEMPTGGVAIDDKAACDAIQKSQEEAQKLAAELAGITVPTVKCEWK